MSYRKIEVDGKEYEYVVGKKNLKIKGVGVFDKEEVGESHEIVLYDYGDSVFDTEIPTEPVRTGVITPAIVARLIKSYR